MRKWPMVALLIVFGCSTGSNPWGEVGSQRRFELESKYAGLMADVNRYARDWNPDGIMIEVYRVEMCNGVEEVAEKSGMPVRDTDSRGRHGKAVARALIGTGIMLMSEPSEEDFFHEAFHLIYMSKDDALADEFMGYCMDRWSKKGKEGDR